MNTRTVSEGQFEFEDIPATGRLQRVMPMLAAIPALFWSARRIARQAKQLYAMSDSALGELGLTREEIPAQLLKSYSE